MGTLLNAIKRLANIDTSAADTLRTAEVTPRLPLLNGSNEMVGSAPLSSVAMFDGVFVYYFSSSADASKRYPRLIKPENWKASLGTPVGVVLTSGGKSLVIALDEATLKWSSADTTGTHPTYITSLALSAADFDGKANTALSAAYSQCAGSEYAPYFCTHYEKKNSDGGAEKGLLAGEWWLPSHGELILIYANMNKVNYALSVCGGTPLPAAGHWSSTELSSTYAWGVNVSNGSVHNHTKSSSSYHVRPVAALKR